MNEEAGSEFCLSFLTFYLLAHKWDANELPITPSRTPESPPY